MAAKTRDELVAELRAISVEKDKAIAGFRDRSHKIQLKLAETDLMEHDDAADADRQTLEAEVVRLGG